LFSGERIITKVLPAPVPVYRSTVSLLPHAKESSPI
jgi:hypothetical protein